MSDREKIIEVVRYMKDCIEDAKKLSIKDYNVVKAVYEYPLEVLEKSEKDNLIKYLEDKIKELNYLHYELEIMDVVVYDNKIACYQDILKRVKSGKDE